MSDTSSIDVLYQNALVPLIHGIGMDDNPNIIPVENIRKAISVVAEWESQRSKSAVLQFEKAWIRF